MILNREKHLYLIATRKCASCKPGFVNALIFAGAAHMWITAAVVIWMLVPGDFDPFWERAMSLIIVAWLEPG